MNFLRKSIIPVLAGILIWGVTSAADDQAAQPSHTIFLVRHAEKTKAPSDPELSEAGQQRAWALAGLLRDAGISRIYSTDYARTRDTAAPLAKVLNLEVEFYQPKELERLADQLGSQSGRQLVVGHSNTTPELVSLLGGDPGTEIQESVEYDRLYLVTLQGDQVTTVLMRYGDGF